jgi:hypothetical protein
MSGLGSELLVFLIIFLIIGAVVRAGLAKLDRCISG